MSACIGSGYCCMKVQCPVSVALHGVQPSGCPDLEWNGARHVCALMLRPSAEGQRYRDVLYEGAGCSSALNSWRREPLRDRRHLPVIDSTAHTHEDLEEPWPTT